MTSEPRPSTQINTRLTPAEVEALDNYRDYIAAISGVPASRPLAIRALIRRTMTERVDDGQR